MNKKILLFLCALVLVGCTYGQSYIDDPKSFIKDPHFGVYKKDRDALEVRYLHKEITYSEYIKAKDVLDETYEKEIQERNDKVISPERNF